MITGAAQMDGTILVVSAADGAIPKHVNTFISTSSWCTKISSILNKADQVDEELIELVKLELRELLDDYEYPGDEIPFVSGSALLALNKTMKILV